MVFWIVFSSLLFMMLSISYFMSRDFKKYYSYILCVILWFISAFRYRIGADYDTYMNLYDLPEGNYLLDYTDPIFKWICMMLNSFNIEYQGLFVFYATVTMFCFYKGLIYFAENENQVLIGLTVFALFPSEYFWTFGLIRQMAAVAILFWGAKYIVERRFLKYLAVVCIAVLFHASAVLALLFYWISVIKISRISGLIITIISLALFSFNIPYKLILLLLNSIESVLGQYANYLINMDATLPLWWIYIFFFYYLYVFCVAEYNDGKKMVLINMSFYVMIVMLIVTETTALYRMRLYGIFFFGSLVAKTIDYLSCRYRSIVPYYAGILFVALFMYTIYCLPINGVGRPNVSSGNIDYEFNFQLIK